MIQLQSTTLRQINCRKAEAEKRGFLPLVLFFCPRKKANAWGKKKTQLKLRQPLKQAASEAQHKDRHYKFSAKSTKKQISHPNPKGAILQRYLRAKPVEEITTNSKFGLKDEAVTIFAITASPCYISMVQIQNKTIIPCVLRCSRLKPGKHIQEIKEELKLSLIMGWKVRKRKKWFEGLPTTTLSTVDS